MKIIVYLEGPSDRLSMEQLFRPLIERALLKGVKISFIGLNPQKGRGNSKRELVSKTPKKAVSILSNDTEAHVCIMPDLYPKNAGGPHETYDELRDLILRDFDELLSRRSVKDARMKTRFHVFCFKHDLEALILAAEEQLASRLRVKSIPCDWIKPVENQDHSHPPKYIVESVFEKYHDHYRGTVDGPLIFSNASYSILAERCPQCFKPFVEYLESFVQS